MLLKTKDGRAIVGYLVRETGTRIIVGSLLQRDPDTSIDLTDVVWRHRILIVKMVT